MFTNENSRRIGLSIATAAATASLWSALLMLGAGIARPEPAPPNPSPDPYRPAWMEPDHPYGPGNDCRERCGPVRLPRPNEPGPVFLNPQPLPPG